LWSTALDPFTYGGFTLRAPIDSDGDYVNISDAVTKGLLAMKYGLWDLQTA